MFIITGLLFISTAFSAYITEEHGDFSYKSKNEWMSTQLYAAAGEVIQVTLDEALIGNGHVS